jgi:hypothetical protein
MQAGVGYLGHPFLGQNFMVEMQSAATELL